MNTLRFGSVCSGIEAASVAWHPLGWRADWLAEIEAFPSSVLAHHYPDMPNLGDMTEIASQVLARNVSAPDILVGGTPCQSFSIAGLRGGLDDHRGQLTLSFIKIANAIDTIRITDGKPPAIVVWENVPGVLSDKTNAFGCFLAGLAGESSELQPPGTKWANAGCVFGPQRTVTWRVLDAQYFGVAQRRRRVFVVASARTDCDTAKILFECEGMRRDFAPLSKPYPTIDCGIWRKRQCNQWVRNGFAIVREGGVSNPTVTEVERLQGFPDGYTKIAAEEDCKVDGPRYKALGNSMAVPVMNWIGKRILAALT